MICVGMETRPLRVSSLTYVCHRNLRPCLRKGGPALEEAGRQPIPHAQGSKMQPYAEHEAKKTRHSRN